MQHLTSNSVVDEKTPRAIPYLRKWWLPLLFAFPLAAIVLGLYFYWFSIADRYIVFLYYHDMGAIVPDTSPFSLVTSSRYWMAGLVAAGLVLVIYGLVNFVLGRFREEYQAPTWWRVWILSAAALVIGIPVITMSQNQPQLPWSLALATTLTAIVGLGAALMPGQKAARDPEEIILLAVDGFGMMWFILILIRVEEIGGWLLRGSELLILMMGLGLSFGVLVLTGSTLIRRYRSRSGRWLDVFLASLIVTYLFLPLVHYLVFSDGFFYISNSDNFFTHNSFLQLIIWLLAGIVAFGLTRIRVKFSGDRTPARNIKTGKELN